MFYNIFINKFKKVFRVKKKNLRSDLFEYIKQVFFFFLFSVQTLFKYDHKL